jgi:hypothetical protein
MEEVPINVKQIGIIAYPSDDMLVPDLVQQRTTSSSFHGSSSLRLKADRTGCEPAALYGSFFSALILSSGARHSLITTIKARPPCIRLEAMLQLRWLTGDVRVRIVSGAAPVCHPTPFTGIGRVSRGCALCQRRPRQQGLQCDRHHSQEPRTRRPSYVRREEERQRDRRQVSD